MQESTAVRDTTLATLARAQGAWYVLAGLWPILHMPSFVAVTGPKREGWLVKTVGVLIVVTGTALLVGARAKEWKTVSVLGAGAAASLGGISFIYASKRRISPIYLLDALSELAITAVWATIVGRRLLRARASRRASAR
ncbi:MAG: hypothetical protein BGO98_41560 [Myxococcales bacterium 68-20]|nr:hypothetical protein [Myxococcales bacterium]OJY27747.1 MAG: hypothetical protein BGO98_41560 [Myxococcales bacterium 68-20]